MKKIFSRKVISTVILIAFFSVFCFPAYPAQAGTDQSVKTEKQEKVKKPGKKTINQEKKGKVEAEAEVAVNEYYSRDDANVIEDEGDPEGRKKKFPWLLVVGGAVVVGVALYFLFAKKPKFDLNVSLGAGVIGSPPTGTYTQKKGTVVNYSYNLQIGYDNLKVKVDGQSVPKSGSVTMDKDHTITATTDKVSKYNLEVSKGAGVDGYPETGIYSNKIGAIVSYSYILKGGYEDLKVKLDGQEVSNSGKVTMNQSHTLTATAKKIGSCPFIYSYDGKCFTFDAEPYGAAVSKGLKRTEWCELEYLEEADGQYKLLVTNELDETQYVDELKLIVVDHPAGTKVAPDITGGVHTISDPLLPLQAYTGEGEDLVPAVSERDGNFWQSRLTDKKPERKEDLRDELIFEFPKPEGAKTAKLLVNACTSFWGAAMGGRFISLYGNKVSDWYDEIDRFGPAYFRLLSWYMNEELYLLKIRVQTGKGWESRGMILGSGPMISKDKVYTLDISDIPGDILRIKLMPPLNFWRIDYLAVDYSDDVPVELTEVAAVTATDHNGINVRQAFMSVDNNLHVMPHIGDYANLDFSVPLSKKGMERTVILKANGYYKIHLDEQPGEPRQDILDRFHNETGFAVQFALKEYLKWEKNDEGRVDKK